MLRQLRINSPLDSPRAHTRRGETRRRLTDAGDACDARVMEAELEHSSVQVADDEVSKERIGRDRRADVGRAAAVGGTMAGSRPEDRRARAHRRIQLHPIDPVKAPARRRQPTAQREKCQRCENEEEEEGDSGERAARSPPIFCAFRRRLSVWMQSEEGRETTGGVVSSSLLRRPDARAAPSRRGTNDNSDAADATDGV